MLTHFSAASRMWRRPPQVDGIARFLRRIANVGAPALIFALMQFVMSTQVRASEYIKPPLEALFEPTITLVSAQLVEIGKPDRLIFRKVRLLHGSTAIPDQMEVRADHDAMRIAHIGDRYVAGLQMFVEDPRQPGRLFANPRGAILLSQPGLDPALFHDDRTMRWLLRAAGSESVRESHDFIRRMVAMLRNPDLGLQRLAVNELVLEPELASGITDDDLETFRRIVLDPHAQPRLRAPLLLAASRQPAQFGAWWRQAAVHLVESTPIDGYDADATDSVGLVLTAFEVLELQHERLPLPSLERWVRGSNPNLAEHALLGIREQVPAREKGVVEAALADPNLPKGTRVFLADHLRRLELLEARGKMD